MRAMTSVNGFSDNLVRLDRDDGRVREQWLVQGPPTGSHKFRANSRQLRLFYNSVICGPRVPSLTYFIHTRDTLDIDLAFLNRTRLAEIEIRDRKERGPINVLCTHSHLLVFDAGWRRVWFNGSYDERVRRTHT